MIIHQGIKPADDRRPISDEIAVDNGSTTDFLNLRNLT